MSQFRELVIESACQIKLRNNCLLIITTDSQQEVALNQVNSLVIETKQCIISVSALVAIQQFNINLVLINQYHQPVIKQEQDTLLRQFKWKLLIKEQLWQEIVKAKMQNQINLANIINYSMPVKISDADEAQLAKIYFHKLFGNDFHRDFQTGDINKELNYGYSIFTSRITVEIASHGYTNVLGIHHHNDLNKLNLACDLVEPFRFIVDNYVFKHQKEIFDQLYRQNLVDLLNLPISYNRRRYQTTILAIQQYVNDCLGILNQYQNLQKIEVKLCDYATIDHV